jgi:hypothetical protein
MKWKDERPSIFEVLAGRPRSQKPKVRRSKGRPTPEEILEEYQEAVLNLALHGVLNPDGSFKKW